MFKKLVATLALLALSVSGLVGIASPASAADGADATLQQLEVHADVSPNNGAFYGSVAMNYIQDGQFYYDVYSSRQALRVYAKPNDPGATIKITGGNRTGFTATDSTDVGFNGYKMASFTVPEAMNQIIDVVVTASDGTTAKTYKLNVSTGSAMPTPQLISNSLTSISTAGGTKGVMYIKNFNRCTYIEAKYKYTDKNGDEQIATEDVNYNFITTDNNGVSKLSVSSYGLTYAYRAEGTVADLVIKNDASLKGSYWDGYWGCLERGYQTSAYADTVVPKSLSFFNPVVEKVEVPASVTQLTAFKAFGRGINANAALSYYLENPATGNRLWLNSSAINNDSMLLTVSGYDTSDEWKTAQTLDLYISQYDNYDGNDENWVYADDEVLFSKKAIGFKPKMVSQVSVSPAKGSVAGGNKVTITGHGIYNSETGRWATVTIGGNPVTDFRGVDRDYYSSTDSKNWDGVAKATFLVPAGAAGPADIVVDMGYGPTTLSQKYIYGDKPTVSSISPSTVAVTGNSIITLNGTNFGVSGTPIVIIDGVKSNYVVRVSASKVLALVPARATAGVVDVDIISSSGGGALDTPAKLTYAARGANPTITKIAPATDGLSGGNEVVITGTGFSTTATGVTIGGVPAKVTSATATTLKIESPTGEAVGAADVVIGTPTGLVTKTKGFTYTADPGITSVSPNSIVSAEVVGDAKVTITGVGFGTSGTLTIGSGSAVKYTATAGGTTISNVVIPTTKAGTIKVSVLPTGAKKAFTSSVVVVGPKVTYVGPEQVDVSWNIFGDANPWTFNGYAVPASPANNGSESVVVLGTGFGTSGTLKIGTVTVPTTSYSDTRITFVAPSSFAAGKYDVTVTPTNGSLAAVSESAVVIGAQLAVPLIEKVAVNTPITDPNRESNPNVFWPLVLTDSNLYTMTGKGFLGSDNGASTKLRIQSFYDYQNNYDQWMDLEIVSKTDTTIVFKAIRSLSTWDWKALQVVTKDNQVVLGEGLYYDMIDDTYNYSSAYLNNYAGLCNKDAIGTYKPAVFTVVDDNSSLTARGTVKLNGTVVTSAAVVWTASGVTIDLDKQTAITDLWGPKKLELLPSDGQDPISWMVTCGVETGITTKINGSTAALTVPAGTSFTPSAEINNPLPGTTWTEPADNYEFQSQETRNARGSWTKGLPVRPGVYYVRAKVAGSIYDTTKYYNLLDPADVKVTITGTPITFTPKLIAGGSSLTYKGQLGDGTNGTSADIGYTVSPTPADAITSVTYQYRNKACTSGNWANGLPKNVALIPNNCGGDGVATGSWEIRVASYTMNANGVDKTILYIPTFEVFDLTINKKDVTLSSVKAEKVYDGTTSVTLSDVVITGGIKDETLVLDPSFARGAAFPEATAGTNKTVTLNGDFKLAGIFNTNYRITNPTMAVKGDIKKANTELKVVPSLTALVLGKTPTVELTVSALDTKTKRAPIAEAGVAEAVVVSKTPAVCTLAGTTVTPVSAGKCVIEMTQAASTNYNAGISYSNSPDTKETVTINIYGTPKDLSIVADDLKVAVGSPILPSASATGLLGEDSFDGVEFDYYSGTTKLDSAPTEIGTYRVVPRGGTLTAAAEDAYTGVKKYIGGKLVITPVPPVITSISPSHGPEAGGETVTIKGTGFSAVTSVTLGAVTIRKPAFTVNAAGTAITFTVPKGVGGLDISLNAGTAQADALYTYDAPFRSPEEPVGPDTPAGPVELDLTLKLKVGTKLSGQKVGIAGGGLQAFSPYKLEMFSDPILVYTGTTDKDGNFSENVTLPAKVCIDAGKHTLKLSGITPEGTPTSDSDSFSLLDKCEVGATAQKTGDKQWTLDGFLFNYNSAVLTAGGKKSIDDLVAFVKGAKTVTILGYTETDTKSKLVKALNLILSKKRTESVMAYLKTKGVKAKFITIGKGGVDPVNLKDQSKNRRVVIKAQY